MGIAPTEDPRLTTAHLLHPLRIAPFIFTAPASSRHAGAAAVRGQADMPMDLTPQYTRPTSVLASQPIRHTPTKTAQCGVTPPLAQHAEPQGHGRADQQDHEDIRASEPGC